ncbi:MAG: DUF559 domain-containing protein [Candidatus Gracilibacteria bacterium]|nr:DUF559 domain-containing protein [Candidatus Gracilibacteria bacterium]MDD5179516.1 DUF559 domain-containing protein [Candidatus Gracilibacteria bacterium]
MAYVCSLKTRGSSYKLEPAKYDKERSAFLAAMGLQILRFDNYEILTNVDGVLERILEGGKSFFFMKSELLWRRKGGFLLEENVKIS